MSIINTAAALNQVIICSVAYIPLKPPHSNAASRSSACQAHKVATTNVAGKQRCTNLWKEHTKALIRQMSQVQ